jgi:hypothetical protein
VALRIAPIVFLAIALAPTTWLRTANTRDYDAPISMTAIIEPGEALPAGWVLGGIWEYEAQSLRFGGFSAMLTRGSDRLQAFSDRGVRFTFGQPDHPQGDPPELAPQLVEPGRANELWDIESATRDPRSGRYWLGYENAHAINRFSLANETDGLRILAGEVDWPSNGGAEAMVRLDDGRFLVVPEGGGEALLYPGDPVEGAVPQRLAWRSPDPDFSITEAAQLPDGRLLFLLRKLAWDFPVFASRIALADLPDAAGGAIEPRIILDLSAVVPTENYEAMAVRGREDGTVELWIMSDDNLSIMQRTLLVQLRLDPRTIGQAGDKTRD